MPHYDFINTKTKKEFDMWCSISEMEQYLKDNPHIKFHVKTMSLGDSVKLGITKPDSSFQKYVLGPMKKAHPKGSVENKFGSIAREW